MQLTESLSEMRASAHQLLKCIDRHEKEFPEREWEGKEAFGRALRDQNPDYRSLSEMKRELEFLVLSFQPASKGD